MVQLPKMVMRLHFCQPPGLIGDKFSNDMRSGCTGAPTRCPVLYTAGAVVMRARPSWRIKSVSDGRGSALAMYEVLVVRLFPLLAQRRPPRAGLKSHDKLSMIESSRTAAATVRATNPLAVQGRLTPTRASPTAPQRP